MSYDPSNLIAPRHFSDHDIQNDQGTTGDDLTSDEHAAPNSKYPPNIFLIKLKFYRSGNFL